MAADKPCPQLQPSLGPPSSYTSESPTLLLATNFVYDDRKLYNRCHNSQTLGNMIHIVWWKILDVSRFLKSDKHGM